MAQVVEPINVEDLSQVLHIMTVGGLVMQGSTAVFTGYDYISNEAHYTF